MKEFKRTEYQFKIDEKVYSVKKPTTRQVSEYEKSVKEKEEKSVDSVVEFLEMLGLPADVSYGLEVDHLVEIVELISGGNKKK